LPKILVQRIRFYASFRGYHEGDARHGRTMILIEREPTATAPLSTTQDAYGFAAAWLAD
jgi:hypothetical protein